MVKQIKECIFEINFTPLSFAVENPSRICVFQMKMTRKLSLNPFTIKIYFFTIHNKINIIFTNYLISKEYKVNKALLKS